MKNEQVRPIVYRIQRLAGPDENYDWEASSGLAEEPPVAVSAEPGDKLRLLQREAKTGRWRIADVPRGILRCSACIEHPPPFTVRSEVLCQKEIFELNQVELMLK